MRYVIPAPRQTTIPVRGAGAAFPVRRVYCIGRNYAAHAVEMGHDPDQKPPFFFQKNPDNLLTDGADFPYPAESTDVHHEVELLVALKRGGEAIAVADALACVFGYAISLDMTRRDLQSAQKKLGRPWEIGKAFEKSAPCSDLIPVDAIGHPSDGKITLSVNGVLRQQGDLNQMIWKTPEIIASLSRYFTLQAGDVILTGTPAGVGPVQPGDALQASIDGLGDFDVNVV